VIGTPRPLAAIVTGKPYALVPETSRTGTPPDPAADIEAVVVKFVKEHLAAKQDKSTTGAVRLGDRGDLEQLVAGIVVYKDRLIVRLKSDNADEASDCPDDRSLTIPWQKPPPRSHSFAPARSAAFGRSI
jgi:hypothetical protein